MNRTHALEQFYEYINQLIAKNKAKKVNDHSFFIGEGHADKKALADLAISTLIHGNEIIGIYLVNEILQKFLSEDLTLPPKVAVILGNLPAFEKGKRFIDKDLNRCFSKKIHINSIEESIVQKIEPTLLKSKMVVDFHQTIEETESAFSIFPYSEKNLSLARRLHETLPAVVSYGGSASRDGRLLTEYCYENNIPAITVELGQAGFDPTQLELGVEIILNLFSYCLGKSQKNRNPKVYKLNGFFSPGENARLNPGLKNFSFLKKGTVIGACADEPIQVDKDSYIIFPKYGKNARSSSELFGNLVQISATEFSERPLE